MCVDVNFLFQIMLHGFAIPTEAMVLFFKNAFWFCREHRGGNISVASFIKGAGVDLKYKESFSGVLAGPAYLPLEKEGLKQPREGNACQ